MSQRRSPLWGQPLPYESRTRTPPDLPPVRLQIRGTLNVRRQSAHPPALISTRDDARVQGPEEHFEREEPSPVSQVDTFAVDCLSEPSVGIEQPRGQRANENPSPSIPTRPCCIRHTRRNRPNQAGWLGFPQRFNRWKDQEKTYRKTTLDHSRPWTTTGHSLRLAVPPTRSIFACLISVK